MSDRFDIFKASSFLVPYLEPKLGEKAKAWAVALWLASAYGGGSPIAFVIVRGDDRDALCRMISSCTGKNDMNLGSAFMSLLNYEPIDEKCRVAWIMARYAAGSGQWPTEEEALKWWKETESARRKPLGDRA